MNIIFGTNQVEELPSNKFTILPLDTIRYGEHGRPDIAYCIVDNIPITELPEVEQNKQLHNKLMSCYQQRNWAECYEIINQLLGKWGGEIDSFYQQLHSRIADLETQNLDDSWTGIIEKAVN